MFLSNKCFRNGRNIRFNYNLRKSFTKDDIKFASVCEIFEKIEKTSQLLNKKEIFKSYILQMIKNSSKDLDMFKKVGQIVKISIPYLNMIQNKLDQLDKQDSLETNLRYQYTFHKLIQNYIKDNYGLNEKQIQKYFIQNGDLAKFLKITYREHILKNNTINNEPPLTVQEILDYKEKIINLIGDKSYTHKLEIFKELISRCKSEVEILYVGRIFLNKLKIGIAEKNIINCILELEKFMDTQEKLYYRQLVYYLEKNIFKYQINYKRNIRPLNNNELIDHENLDFEITLQPGTFVELQLGRTGMDLESFISTITKSNLKFLLETKYDGERSQLHFNGKELYMGSRSSTDQTFLYQTLKNDIENQIKINRQIKHKVFNFILDGEIVCFDHKEKIFSNFQDLRKKLNAGNSHNEIQYFFIAFDVLYLNNQNIYKFPLEFRKIILQRFFLNKYKNIVIEPGKVFDFNQINLVTCKNQITDFFNFAKTINCEGLIAKEMGRKSHYHFGKRRWYKLKTLNSSSSDTLDLVPIAGFIGRGSKNNLMNSFLVAAYDFTNDLFLGICKLGTGFDQQDLTEIRDRLTPYLLQDIPENYVIPMLLRPSVIFKPIEVWEVGFDSFSQSSNYSIGKGVLFENKGLSLRFPRFIRFRHDKSIKNATSINNVISFYNSLHNKKFKRE